MSKQNANLVVALTAAEQKSINGGNGFIRFRFYEAILTTEIPVITFC